jgi:proline iminopeptidase
MIKWPKVLCLLILLLLQLLIQKATLKANVQALKEKQPTQNGLQSSGAQTVEEGYVSTEDGTRLYYQKVGHGPRTVIIPGALFLFNNLRQLTEGRTLIFYDMRGRGRSAPIPDNRKSEMVSIYHDVKDVERISRHFNVEKFSLIGYSYLGLMVVMYGMDHPGRVERIVQIGPVPLKFGTKYPDNLTNSDKLADIGASRDEIAKVEKMLDEGYDKSNPQDFCEKQWQVTRFRLVGNPANVDKLGQGLCDLPNEWPMNLGKHFQYSFVSVQRLDIPREKVAQVSIPVLTIHGTKDRNAPYGAGREWALMLPNARLLTVKGAAHQSFAEYPEAVIPAIRTFLDGKWPAGSEKVTEINQR